MIVEAINTAFDERMKIVGCQDAENETEFFENICMPPRLPSAVTHVQKTFGGGSRR